MAMDFSNHTATPIHPSTYNGNKSTTNWSKASDAKDDIKHGIKPGSPQDKSLDKKRGV